MVKISNVMHGYSTEFEAVLSEIKGIWFCLYICVIDIKIKLKDSIP